MVTKTQKRQLIRSVRLDEATVTAILDELDASCGPGACERRRNARYRYRTRACVVHMQQAQDSSAVAYLVPTRDLSSTGLAFLHGGYVHVGTPCLAELLARDGGARRVLGTVARCRLIRGTLHEVGIRFVEDIETSDFAGGTRHDILLAAGEANAPRTFRLTLDQLGCDVLQATNAAAAIELAGKRPYDLILLDMNTPELDGLQTCRALRANGALGLLIACADGIDEAQLRAFIDAGADRCLGNPPGRTALYAVLTSLRHAPVYGRRTEKSSDRQSIATYLDELVCRLHVVESCIHAENWSSLAACALDIKGTGVRFGYPSITELGTQLEVALSDKQPRRTVAPVLATLWDRCLRARLGFRRGRPENP